MSTKGKGVVYKSGDTWYYRVYDREGKSVLMDNTGNWRVVFDGCFKDAKAVQRIECAGHRFVYSYPELVDRAAGL